MYTLDQYSMFNNKYCYLTIHPLTVIIPAVAQLVMGKLLYDRQNIFFLFYLLKFVQMQETESM